jgi:uncharacterized membrane protein
VAGKRSRKRQRWRTPDSARSAEVAQVPPRSDLTPREERDRDHPISVRASMVRVSSGPLPSPEVLARYDQIVPGGAERIFGWVESQTSHRQQLETAKIQGDLRNSRLGQHYAFILALVISLIGAFLIYKGKDVSGLSLIIGEIATLAGAFLWSKHSQNKALGRRREQLDNPEVERRLPSKD